MSEADRIRLVVLFGGQSAEHEVSCVSAYHVLQAVDPERYEVDAIGITRDGRWVRDEQALEAMGRGRAALPSAEPARAIGAAAAAGAAGGAAAGAATDGGGGVWSQALVAAGTEVEPLPAVTGSGDGPLVVLPVLHGTRGEDGTVQGMLELAGVPFVGSGVLGSALCMDKLKAKDVLAAHGIPQVPWIGLRDTELDQAAARVTDAGLRYPVFVKPANCGSSVGVSRAADEAGLAAACAVAARYDEWIVVEEGVTAREIEVAVLGNEDPRASVPGEIVPTHDFYDYEDKYLDGAAEAVIPAALSEEATAEVRRLAVEAFTILRCEGLARVDFFYEDATGRLLLNEVNTIPGFTPISMYPKLWAATGLDYPSLIDELVRLALERHARRTRLTTAR